MPLMGHTALVVVSSLVATQAGCLKGTCETGTVRHGDTCVLVDPYDKTPPTLVVTPPRYTRAVGTVTLTSDKPAEIYYTIDGTPPTLDSASGPDRVVIANVPDDAQLRYFAVDLAGNQSAEQVLSWIIDRVGPIAPPSFHLAFSPPSRTVTWSMPTDPRPGGVLVARVDGRLGAPPTAGKGYAVGDELSPGVTVVAIAPPDPSGTFTESATAKPGMVRYVAWAFDDLHNYGPAAGDYALVAVPAQSATINVNAGSGAVVVGAQPANLTMSGTAHLAGATLTLQLSMRNDTTRTLYAPKLALQNPLGAVTWTNPDGLLGMARYRSYGAARLPGAIATAQWTFTGVTASTVLALQVDLTDGYLAGASLQRSNTSGGVVVDLATGVALLDLPIGPTGQNGQAGTVRAAITPDARLVAGSRTAGAVTVYDLVTGHRQATTTLKPQKATIPQLIVDASGSTVYALVSEGHPSLNNRTAGTGAVTQLVTLDAATLTELGPRVELGSIRSRSMEISPDGKRLIVASGLTSVGVIVVDLTTMQLAPPVLTGFRPQCALFTPDGKSIVVVGEQVAVVGTEGAATVMYPTPGTKGKVVRAVFAPSGLLWIGRQQETVTVDLATGMSQEFDALPGQMIQPYDGKMYVGSSNLGMAEVDAAGAVVTHLTGFGALRGHWIGRSPF